MARPPLVLLILGLVAGAVLIVVLVTGPDRPAPPAKPPALERVIQDDTVFLAEPAGLGDHLDQIEGLGFTRLRVTAGWSVLAPDSASTTRPDFEADDPAAYEEYDLSGWENLDRLVREADARGIRLLVDIAFWAPLWAAEPTAGGVTHNPRTNINVEDYRQFALAVVRRYDGSYSPPGQDELPRVDMFAIWNEPNISGFFGPQWQPDGPGGRLPRSPHLYRNMVAAAYPAIKEERPEAQVLVGNLAAGGSYENAGLKGGVPPLQFLRELACVDRHLQPIDRSGCQRFGTVPGDGLAIHPYSFRYRPDAHGAPDDVRIGDLDKLIALLRELANRGRIAPSLVDVYITELGYKTNPPDPGGVSYEQQLQQMLWSEAIVWDRPEIKTFAQFLVRDSVCAGCLFWPTGYLDGESRPKPLMNGFSLGAIAISDGARVRLWGRAGGDFQDRPLRFEYRAPDGAWKPASGRTLNGGAKQTRGALSAQTIPLQQIPEQWRLAAQTDEGWQGGPAVATVG